MKIRYRFAGKFNEKIKERLFHGREFLVDYVFVIIDNLLTKPRMVALW